MTTNVQPPSAHPKWDAFTSSFKQSNYITDFWNWFMTLMSKAAEMVLFGTVLYSGYQLLPGVPHVPATLDAAVFVIQQGARDISGAVDLERGVSIGQAHLTDDTGWRVCRY